MFQISLLFQLTVVCICTRVVAKQASSGQVAAERRLGRGCSFSAVECYRYRQHSGRECYPQHLCYCFKVYNFLRRKEKKKKRGGGGTDNRNAYTPNEQWGAVQRRGSLVSIKYMFYKGRREFPIVQFPSSCNHHHSFFKIKICVCLEKKE